MAWIMKLEMTVRHGSVGEDRRLWGLQREQFGGLRALVVSNDLVRKWGCHNPGYSRFSNVGRPTLMRWSAA
jgi:hypothetical protein